MATFTVNGQTVTVEKNQKLIRYLRDQLHLTSVKDGCSEGACGTCHVLIDGKPTKACIPQTDKLEGKTIVTVEGLTDWEKQVYTFAFGEAGAVQCGFCIPGMVISAKGLLDVNPDPTREEAAFAIRNNIHNADADFPVFHIVHHAGVGRTVKKSAAFVIVDVVPDIG